MFDYAEEQYRREQREKEEANQRAKRAETGAHNAEHKNERTPERNQGKKTKTGPSPKKELPPFPTGAPPSSQPKSEEPPPESTHEQRGKVGRPKNTQDHDVPYDDNDKVSYWMRQPAEYIRRQAFKRGLDPNSVTRSNGKPWTIKEYKAWMKDWLAKEAKKKK